MSRTKLLTRQDLVPGHARLRLGRVTGLVPTRTLVVALVMAAIAVVAYVSSIVFGNYFIGLDELFRILTGRGEGLSRAIVIEWRAGRATVAFLVGACLAFGGAITQTVARNPLVSPDVLGVTQGASLAVVATLLLSARANDTGATARMLRDTVGLPAMALIGATATTVAVVLIVGRNWGDTLRIVLMGIAVSMFLGAFTTWLMAKAGEQELLRASLWLNGSVNDRGWQHAWAPMATLLAAVLLASWLVFALSALALGPQVAHVLGIRVKVAQIVQLAVAVVLAAIAVSAAGPVGFVAFVAPQIARWASKAPTPPILTAMLCGGALVTAADVAARLIIPWSLPVGIVTSLIGAPVLLYLVIQQNRRSTI
ncbi:FecCD family ABC transporter permease [Corynebacterium sphenisci]|uniref:FecCD family ABC transporter permease n=1 Tax=Corynebacterium sphenisci TaxID=191493 RepID=UPI0026DF08FE|nr:iron ABC transporter permease [Corynebacterium sphenisci]MDO5730554.1 iron ABC transporter permease [Corynebacterium sphenisci]